MTISKQAFATGMAMMFKNCGRSWDEDTSRMYYAAIGKRLDDATFGRTVQSLIAKRDFWPSIAAILAEAEAPVQNYAAESFEAVSSAVRAAGGHRFYPYSAYDALSAPTKAGIRAVGGIAAFSLMSDRQLQPALKAFVAAYRAADAGEQPRLLPPVVMV